MQPEEKLPEALITVDDNIVAMWFLVVDAGIDWMGGLSRMPDGSMRFANRLRYYNPESRDPHDGKDRKKEQILLLRPEGQGTEADLIEQVRRVVGELTQHAIGPLYELLRGNRSVEEFMDELKRQPWAHTKVERIYK